MGKDFFTKNHETNGPAIKWLQMLKSMSQALTI